jgi:ketohexokinase
MDSGGKFHHAPAIPPPEVVDTLGAGDVFNAGIIDALVQNRPFEEVLVEASKLAGRKCGQYGLAHLVES